MTYANALGGFEKKRLIYNLQNWLGVKPLKKDYL